MAATLFAAPAHATPQQDGQFLYGLGEAGLAYESATTVIVLAKEVCAALLAGAAPEQIVSQLDRGTALDRRGAVMFVALSVAAYCGHRPGDGPRRNFQHPRDIRL